MTTSFVGAASAEATSLTLPTHERGDLIVICATRLLGATIPRPAGWNTLFRRDAGGLSTLVLWKIANSSQEISGTFTNATLLSAGVWRHSTNILAVNGVSSSTQASSATVTFIAIGNETANSGQMTTNNWVGAFAISTLNSIDFENPPTGMINRDVISGISAVELALHDTNADVASWASTNRTASATAGWQTFVFSIEPMGVDKVSGGLLLPRSMDGGYAS